MKRFWLFLACLSAVPVWLAAQAVITPGTGGAGASGSIISGIVQGRLTLTSGTPVTTSDVTGASTLYWTPYRGNSVALYSGTTWVLVAVSEKSLTLTALTSGLNYDVFLNYNAGAPALGALVAWTNDTTRATALTQQDGVYVKSGDSQQRYVGTIRTTSTTTTEDSGGGSTTQVGGKRFVFNYYNRVLRPMAVIDDTNTWVYSTATIRQANGAAGNKVEFVVGVAEEAVQAHVQSSMTVATSAVGFVGIGLNSTSTFSGLRTNSFISGAANINGAASLMVIPAEGYHFLSWNEKGAGAGTTTWQGDNAADGTQSGLVATIAQ